MSRFYNASSRNSEAHARYAELLASREELKRREYVRICSDFSQTMNQAVQMNDVSYVKSCLDRVVCDFGFLMQDNLIKEDSFRRYREAQAVRDLKLRAELMQLLVHRFSGIEILALDSHSGSYLLSMCTTEQYYSAFVEFSRLGHITNMTNFVKSMKTKGIQNFKIGTLISYDNFAPFRQAVSAGQLKSMEWLLENCGETNPVKRQIAHKQMISEGLKTPFLLACERGHVEVIKYLLAPAQTGSKDASKKLFVADNFHCVRMASAGGSIDMLEYLFEFSQTVKTLPGQEVNINIIRIIAASAAATNGQLRALQFLWDTSDPFFRVGKTINALLLIATKGMHCEVVQFCCDKFDFVNKALGRVPDSTTIAESLNILKQIPTDGSDGFKTRERVRSVSHVLLKYSCWMYHADLHNFEYKDKFLSWFVMRHVEDLRDREVRFYNDHPNDVFDITIANEIQVAYVCMRNLIRHRGVPDQQTRDALQYLLRIPSVSAVAHIPHGRMNGDQNDNGLFHLAAGCSWSSSILLQHPLIARQVQLDREAAFAREAAIRDSRRNVGISFTTRLARNVESSMTGLNSSEQKCLKKLVLRYGQRLTDIGDNNVLESLRAFLITSYRDNPAQYIIVAEKSKKRTADVVVNLPLTMEEFRNLNLTPSERESALKSYYQHKVHTAIRYLSKPNHWMDPRALYVRFDGNGRFSSFEEYIHSISLFYLAAIDEEAAPTDGGTVKLRIENFITEISLIGRAHNWDKSRPRKVGVGTEEYDDLLGDKPSCYSGVNRRLFQSVVGHPDMLCMLTQEVLDQYLRSFVRSYWEEQLVDRKNEIIYSWRQYIETLSDEHIAVLRSLDIPVKRQALLLTELSEQYGEDQVDTARIAQVKLRFEIDSDSCHVIKLAGFASLYQLLNLTESYEDKKEQELV